jgi:hypothetical protein
MPSRRSGVPVDVRAAHVDILATGGHKWLCGPFGTGFAYIRQELCEAYEPRPARLAGLRVQHGLRAPAGLHLGPAPRCAPLRGRVPAIQGFVGSPRQRGAAAGGRHGPRHSRHVPALQQPLLDWAAATAAPPLLARRAPACRHPVLRVADAAATHALAQSRHHRVPGRAPSGSRPTSSTRPRDGARRRRPARTRMKMIHERTDAGVDRCRRQLLEAVRSSPHVRRSCAPAVFDIWAWSSATSASCSPVMSVTMRPPCRPSGRACRGCRHHAARDEVTRLPDPGFGGMRHALVRRRTRAALRVPGPAGAPDLPARAGHARRDCCRRDGEWLRIRGEDGYLGWVHSRLPAGGPR